MKPLMKRNTHLVDELRQVGPNTVLRGLLAKWPLTVVSEQVIGLRKGSLASLMAKGCKGILEDISSVGGANHGNGAHITKLERLGADAAADLLLGTTVGDGMGGHVEEEEIALLGTEDALVDKALCESFSDLLELVPDLHQVPGLAYCSKRSCDAHLFALLHHLKGFVKENLAGEGVVYDFDVAVCEGESASRSVLFHCNATAEGQLDDDASSQGLVSGPLSLALGVLVLGAAPLLESPSPAGPAPPAPRRRVNPEDISKR
ncbi:hypothetical protein HG531_006078 [Fusarium graminearum]|nr:hypothetical protein HG531_006078 [Fusarium graminearum]